MQACIIQMRQQLGVHIDLLHCYHSPAIEARCHGKHQLATPLSVIHSPVALCCQQAHCTPSAKASNYPITATAQTECLPRVRAVLCWVKTLIPTFEKGALADTASSHRFGSNWPHCRGEFI